MHTLQVRVHQGFAVGFVLLRHSTSVLPTMCPLASILCDPGKKGTHPRPHWYDCCKCLGIGAEQLILCHALLPYFFIPFLPRLYYYMCCLYFCKEFQIPTQVLCRQCRSSLTSLSLAQCIFWPFEKLTFKKSLFRYIYFKCTSILHAWCLRRSEEGTRSFGPRDTGCEPSRVFWELNPGLL